MHRYFSTSAFVISSDTFGEIDLIVNLFSKDFGKIYCIAKGAKKSKRRFMNALEPFTLLKINLILRDQTTFSFLESATIIDSFDSIRSNYINFFYGSLGLELIDMWCKEGQRDDEIFTLFHWFLKSISLKCEPKLCTLIFKAKLLKAVGVFPRLDKCATCGQTPKGTKVSYSIDSGEIYCENCNKDKVENSISLSALKSLIYFRENGLDKIFRLKVSKKILDESWSYLKKRHSFVLEQEPKSYKLLKFIYD